MEASQAFVPDVRFGNGDQRSLAIRVFDVGVHARARPARLAD
jgi:hypothetical protein